jgi:hypothetical protein
VVKVCGGLSSNEVYPLKHNALSRVRAFTDFLAASFGAARPSAKDGAKW